MADAPQKKKLTAEQLESIREFKITVDLRGFWKGWKKIFHDMPSNAVQNLMVKADKKSRSMMFGKASFFGMPLGLILRNTSRVIYNSNDGKYSWLSSAVGTAAAVVAVAGSAVYLGPAAVGLVAAGVAKVGLTGVAAALPGTLGSIASGFVAGSAALLFASIPAYTAAKMAFTGLLGLGAAVFSVIPAVANVPQAIKRTKLAMQGYDMSDEQVKKQEEEFDRESPSLKEARLRLDATLRNIVRMEAGDRQIVQKKLSDIFDREAAVKQALAESAAMRQPSEDTQAPKPKS